MTTKTDLSAFQHHLEVKRKRQKYNSEAGARLAAVQKQYLETRAKRAEQREETKADVETKAEQARRQPRRFDGTFSPSSDKKPTKT